MPPSAACRRSGQQLPKPRSAPHEPPRWRACPAISFGASVHSATQSTKPERIPWGTHPILLSRSSLDTVLPVRARPVGDGNTNPPASPRIQQVPGDGWVFQVSCLRQHGHGGIAERHFVLKISPHSRGRYGPDEVFLVDFIPSREPCLTGPDGGQSDKLHAELR